MNTLPRMLTVRQKFPERHTIDIPNSIADALEQIPREALAGKRIAVGVGSRGITNFLELTQVVVSQLKKLGAFPFLFPAMGSHGGATEAGQLEILASYGIDQEQSGAPIHANMETMTVGKSRNGIDVVCATSALNSDGIILINRIKPHTDFFGAIGSGLIKMSVVGLGKQVGASKFHLAASEVGYEQALMDISATIFEATPLLGGIAILEDEQHHTAHIEWIPKYKILQREPELLAMARSMMPCLKFPTIDLLIIDEIGKNISGAGLDPNITQRSIHGYNTLPIAPDEREPFVRRIFVRDVTQESHGNSVGIGMADATTKRLVEKTDWTKTYLNGLTSMTPNSVKIPLTFDNDKSAIEAMLQSLPIQKWTDARIVRIKNTLELTNIQISEKLWSEVSTPDKYQIVETSETLRFTPGGDLLDCLSTN